MKIFSWALREFEKRTGYQKKAFELDPSHYLPNAL
jgi:hypothetical protein